MSAFAPCILVNTLQTRNNRVERFACPCLRRRRRRRLALSSYRACLVADPCQGAAILERTHRRRTQRLAPAAAGPENVSNLLARDGVGRFTHSCLELRLKANHEGSLPSRRFVRKRDRLPAAMPNRAWGTASAPSLLRPQPLHQLQRGREKEAWRWCPWFLLPACRHRPEEVAPPTPMQASRFFAVELQLQGPKSAYWSGLPGRSTASPTLETLVCPWQM